VTVSPDANVTSARRSVVVDDQTGTGRVNERDEPMCSRWLQFGHPGSNLAARERLERAPGFSAFAKTASTKISTKQRHAQARRE
jgi:hypothetical protein